MQYVMPTILGLDPLIDKYLDEDYPETVAGWVKYTIKHKQQWYSGESVVYKRDDKRILYLKEDGGFIHLNFQVHDAYAVWRMVASIQAGWLDICGLHSEQPGWALSPSFDQDYVAFKEMCQAAL